MQTKSSMRALRLSAVNGIFEKIDMPRPSPGPGEVLVRIHASGVNPLDSKIRAGEAPHARHPLPAILGMDLAGVVESLGQGVTNFEVGDQVCGLTGGVGGLQGSLADYAAVDAHLLAHKPARLSMRDAAALPLVIITAWEGLVDRAKVQPGQKVLIQGGAGGVGHVAVQIARALGADVFATARPEHAAIIRDFGATPIDYLTQTPQDYVAACTGGSGFDVIYDTVGGPTLDACFSAVRTHGGHVVSCLGWGVHKLAPLSFRAATYSGVFALLPMLSGTGRAHHGGILRQAASMIDAGRLTPLMDPRRFGFDEALAAHEEVALGRMTGRVVVDVLESPLA